MKPGMIGAEEGRKHGARLAGRGGRRLRYLRRTGGKRQPASREATNDRLPFGRVVVLAWTAILPTDDLPGALYAMAKPNALNVPVIGIAFQSGVSARLHNRVSDGIKQSCGSMTSVPSIIFCLFSHT